MSDNIEQSSVSQSPESSVKYTFELSYEIDEKKVSRKAGFQHLHELIAFMRAMDPKKAAEFEKQLDGMSLPDSDPNPSYWCDNCRSFHPDTTPHSPPLPAEHVIAEFVAADQQEVSLKLFSLQTGVINCPFGPGTVIINPGQTLRLVCIPGRQTPDLNTVSAETTDLAQIPVSPAKHIYQVASQKCVAVPSRHVDCCSESHLYCGERVPGCALTCVLRRGHEGKHECRVGILGSNGDCNLYEWICAEDLTVRRQDRHGVDFQVPDGWSTCDAVSSESFVLQAPSSISTGVTLSPSDADEARKRADGICSACQLPSYIFKSGMCQVCFEHWNGAKPVKGHLEESGRIVFDGCGGFEE